MSHRHAIAAAMSVKGFDGLNAALENLLAYMADELPGELTRAGFKDAAQKLSKQVEQFDGDAAIPYSLDGMQPADIKAAYDRTATALARMSGQLYRHVSDHCQYGDHSVMMGKMLENMHSFNRSAQPVLRQMGLEYHEYDSLTLELESKLGVGIGTPPPAEKHDRRRSLPKNPQRIEMALRDCLETARQIRPMINNQARQHTLDRIVGEVSSILTNLPQGEDEISKGRRISALVSGTAKILRVGKWIRKVDLLENEQSESTKREILRSFEDLTAISRGQEPGASRA